MKNAQTLTRAIVLVLALLVPLPMQAITSKDLHAIIYDTNFYDKTDVSALCGSTPANGKAVTSNSLEDFVDAYGQGAYDNSIHSGVPYEFTLAQAIIESGYGKSGLTIQANNFFGIKAGGSWSGATISFPTQEFINGSSVTVQALFRKYASPQDSFADHDKFLRENPRYAAAFQYSKDPFQFLVEIKKAGYATDPAYVQTVGGVIQGVQAYVASKHLFPPSSAVVYIITPLAGATGSPAAGAGGANPCADPAASVSLTGYKNPLRDIKNLTRMRIDQGVDYGGSGPVYAVGNATVIYSSTSAGWPGGNFISYKLKDGAAAGKVIFFAENCDTKVKPGENITSDTVICQMNDASPHTETGWGVPEGSSIAAAHSVYHEGDVTAYGVNFSTFMEKIGAPPGVNNGTPVVGSLPAGWPTWQ